MDSQPLSFHPVGYSPEAIYKNSPLRGQIVRDFLGDG